MSTVGRALLSRVKSGSYKRMKWKNEDKQKETSERNESKIRITSGEKM